MRATGNPAMNRPTQDELRSASLELRTDRIRAEMERTFGTTRRGRLALRISRWVARRRRLWFN